MQEVKKNRSFIRKSVVPIQFQRYLFSPNSLDILVTDT